MTASYRIDIKGDIIRAEAVREAEYSIFYLLVKDTVFDIGSGRRAAYGIACFYMDGEDGGDSSFVCDVTSSEMTAEEIFSRIVLGHVTPCTLRDVTEDLVSGEESL